MKRAALALLFVLALHAPWRLWVLGAEVIVMKPAIVHQSNENDQYWEALNLENRLISLGWAVSYEEDLSANGVEAYGVTDPKNHTIYIDKTLSWNARHAVLAHEGGHALQLNWFNYQEAEVFAESVAMLVAHDGVREHARYLAGLKLEFVLIALVEWPAIYHAAAVLEDR